MQRGITRALLVSEIRRFIMKNLKNIACVVLAGILALGMCSCGKKKNSGKSADLSVKKGDTVTFGSYGGKKIEWIVLDTGDNGALIISKEGLDAKQVDDQAEMIEYLWEDCDLRAWLNGEFYDKSFSDDEKQKINKSTVKFEKCPEEYAFASEGKDVEDYVFLLSYSEAEKYFKSDSDRKCPISETAKNNGGKELGGYCRWWLRTNAVYKNSFIIVERDGSYRTNSGTSGNQTEVCVRPAMWVTI